MFITESMRMFAASAAFFISSAACSSGVVGAWTTSKPTSRASFMRSAKLSLASSISKTRPFLIGKGDGGGVASTALDAVEVAKSSAPTHTPSPAETDVATVDFRKSRRDGLLMHTSPARGRSAQFIQINLRVPLFLGL